MKKKVILACYLALLVLGLIYAQQAFGVSADKLEEEARREQQIPSHWQLAKNVNETIGALLFYDEETGDSTYAIYLPRKGLSFGYFFRAGGVNSEIREGTPMFSYVDQGSAILSMNKEKIAAIELELIEGTKTIPIDPERPFALALPKELGVLRLYDQAGKELQLSVVNVME